MRRYLIVLLAVVGMSILAFKNKSDKPVVDIVFCLDLSRSTDGLIDIFKSQIWAVVNQISDDESLPELRVGIVGYGQPTFGQENQYVRIFSPLTTDIDECIASVLNVDHKAASAGNFPGVAVQACVKQMDWVKGDNTQKMIFWIGNGNVKNDIEILKKQCKKASKKDIRVNTVFVNTDIRADHAIEWEQVANWGGGTYHILNQRDLIISNETDMTEDMILDAGDLLGDTYIFYGVSGIEKKVMFDKLNAMAGSSSRKAKINRILFQASRLYQGRNYKWDLIDFSRKAYFDVAKVDRKLLPKKWQGLADEMLAERIQKKREDRDQAVNIINMLAVKLKDKYVQQMDVEDKKKPLKLDEIFLSTFKSISTVN